MMDVLTRLEFASDAMLLTLTGAGCWGLSVMCLLFEQLRAKRRSLERLEKVGWVPWTGLFMGLAIIGGGCIAMGLPVVLGQL